MDATTIRRSLQAATRAFESWRRTAFEERAALLNSVAHVLRTEAPRLAALITTEMGKPVREARSEIEKCAVACEHCAGSAARVLGDADVPLDTIKARVTYQPLGPLLAIMPWNFPFWQVFRAAAPALMTGNTVVLKLASNTTGCALAIEEVFRKAGLPEGGFVALRVPGDAMRRVIRNKAIAAVTLTGSTTAGRKVAAIAGAALKKTVLELGGSDPYVILEDADLDLAARVCATARLINCGQSCIAAKRFIVVDAVREAFTAKLVAAMAARQPGDPALESTDLGPMARHDLRDELHDQVTRAIAAGARLLCGGTVPAGPGAFYPPTVLDGVTPRSPAFAEETFGPVAAVVAARDEARAIALANATSFGLGAAVFTRDMARGTRIARDELRAGIVAINDFVRSDPRVPFGGTGDSGYGRELGEPGFREFANIKTLLNVE